MRSMIFIKSAPLVFARMFHHVHDSFQTLQKCLHFFAPPQTKSFATFRRAAQQEAIGAVKRYQQQRREYTRKHRSLRGFEPTGFLETQSITSPALVELFHCLVAAEAYRLIPTILKKRKEDAARKAKERNAKKSAGPAGGSEEEEEDFGIDTNVDLDVVGSLPGNDRGDSFDDFDIASVAAAAGNAEDLVRDE